MSVGMSWLVIGLVVVSLWGLWLWLGAIFDAISDYWKAAREREDSQAARERGD